MRSILLLILFALILIVGCASSKQDYQTFFDPEYNVIDRGAFDVRVISRACSETFEDALSAAKNNGKFHLRSVVGSKTMALNLRKLVVTLSRIKSVWK